MKHATVAMTQSNANPATDKPASNSARDDALRVALDALQPGCLGSLDRVWDLCAEELYGLALWRTGSRSDAQDAVQEVFVRLAGKAGSLGGLRKPMAYLLTMVHHAAIDTLRKRRRIQRSEQEAACAFLHEDCESSSRTAALCALLERLPAAQREVVFLKHFMELGFREIGKISGVPVFTAASRYRLAMRRLRGLLGVEL